MTFESDFLQPIISGGSVPDESTLEMMRLSLFDWAACGRAGADEPVSRIVRAMILAEGGRGECALFGGGAAPMRGAALVNGAVSHALDYDDTHFAHIGHPSVAVCSAALAVGQSVGASFDDILMAALIGAEVSVRVGVWLGRAHYQTGFHQTATAGCFGAAAAAARLLGCDADQSGHAIGLAATRASGLKAQFGTMGKPYNAGIAASNGVEVALLARAGFQARTDALSCALGFGETHAGEAAQVPGGWLFPDISHKFHACCHGLHAMLEALGHIKVDPENVEKVEIFTHSRWLTVCNQPAPSTGLGAKFSFRMTAAMRLAGVSTAALDSYSDATCADPRLTALREKVKVIADDTLAETAARVEVTAGGKIHLGEHDLSTPIPMDERAAKLRAKAAAMLGDRAAESLWQAVRQGDTAALFIG